MSAFLIHALESFYTQTQLFLKVIFQIMSYAVYFKHCIVFLLWLSPQSRATFVERLLPKTLIP